MATVTRKVLEVLGEKPVSSEPGEGALNHPAARQNDEAPHVVALLDDLHAQPRRLCHRSFNLPRVVVAVGPEESEPREAPVDLVEDQPGSISSWIAAEWKHSRGTRAGAAVGVGGSGSPVAALTHRVWLGMSSGAPIPRPRSRLLRPTRPDRIPLTLSSFISEEFSADFSWPWRAADQLSANVR